MYDDHVPVIADAARRSPEVFGRVCLFTLLSIRSLIVTVPGQLADVAARGEYSNKLYGMKRDGFRFIRANRGALHTRVCAENDPVSALLLVYSIPGLGVIKSAFVLQMLGFDVACLDSRNMSREGRSTTEYASRKYLGPKYFKPQVEQYIAETSGRSRELWDLWCMETGTKYGWTAESISRLHLDCCVAPEYRRNIKACDVCPRAFSNDIPF